MAHVDTVRKQAAFMAALAAFLFSHQFADHFAYFMLLMGVAVHVWMYRGVLERQVDFLLFAKPYEVGESVIYIQRVCAFIHFPLICLMCCVFAASVCVTVAGDLEHVLVMLTERIYVIPNGLYSVRKVNS